MNFLSTKVSILLPRAILSKDNAADLQQAIDSNYGLFGVIITGCRVADISCPNQKILFASQSTVEETEDGKQKLIPKNDYAEVWIRKFEENSSFEQVFVNSPYILLYNPPPLHQEWGFRSPRKDEKVYFQKNEGDIIGRVYLLRADKPSFVGELQRRLKDIPNSLSISSVKTHISSRSLVYNSIAISTLITGLLVLLVMEFTYYLTRVAQENEAQAVKDKLNTEQKLRNALDSVREADQDKQESEEIARIAAEKSEQAIQEKLKAEEAARIAANESEQAIRQKQESEEAARIAAEKSEQAIQEKLKAEEAARIAANEREQSRRNEIDLYDTIEVEIEQATRGLEKKIEVLQRENHTLKSASNGHQIEAMNNALGNSLRDESNLIHFELTESDFYSLERRELILDILRNVNNVYDDSRRYHILQDLVRNNNSTGNREALKAEIQSLFRDYRRMNAHMRSTLERMGFEIISEANHYKIRFREDNRYVVTFAKTPSDRRAGMNIARDICNLLL